MNMMNSVRNGFQKALVRTLAHQSTRVTPVVGASNLTDAQYDGVVLLFEKFENIAGALNLFQSSVAKVQQLDKSFDKVVSLHICDELPSKRLVLAPTGPLNRDYDDVRRVAEAAAAGIKRAVQAGCQSPLLVHPDFGAFSLAHQVAALGALDALYMPLDIRESNLEKQTKVDCLGLYSPDLAIATSQAKIIAMQELGKVVCRDIHGGDPERMAPPKVAEYVLKAFKETAIKVEVISDFATLSKEYPMLCAVNRACQDVDRHQARVIKLEYVGEGPIEQTLMFVGKGITYDTGGADLKVNGCMAGMHRDKGGAAFIAGFFQVLNAYKPKGLKVVGTMAVVRNSIGPNSYVADEVIISRAGVRVRIGNTDAEGRMVMCDPLCEMKERAANEINPQIMTVATLTGHVIRAYSCHYTAIMENGPAKKLGLAQALFDIGEKCGDPFEMSTIRREDYITHTGKTESDDVLQSESGPSTQCPRGHQSPAAFLIMSSGLDKHGIDSDKPLPYCHVDIAGSSGDFPDPSTGRPVVAFTQAYILNRASGAQ